MSAPDFASYSAKRWAELLELERTLAERGHPPSETERGVFYSVTGEVEALVDDGLAELADDAEARGQVGGQLAELTPAGWAVAHAVRRWQGEGLDRSDDARAEAAATAWIRERAAQLRRRGGRN